MKTIAFLYTRNLVLFVAGAALTSGCGGSLNLPNQSGAPANAALRSPTTVAAKKSGYQQLYAFKGTPDGASPYSGLIAMGGVLFGTTLNGSTNYCSQSCGGNLCYLGCGTVFTIDSSGSEQVVYNFKGDFDSAHDGSWPFAGLTALGGQMYGTTSSAGAHNAGVVYTLSGSGSEQVIYSFAGAAGNDGAGPEASLVPYKNLLFGTTVSGGSGCGGSGCGIVYSVSTAGSETVLYRFKGGNDGNRVYAPLTVLHGKLYGATLFGGGGACGSTGCGTIFEVTTAGKEHVLYRFAGGSGGAYPNGLIAVKGVLYGTTEGGGSRNSGTFFSVTRSGQFATLYNFQDIPDGNLPGASLIYSKGNLYGTTVGGGTVGDGTVFKITPAGNETVLYSFGGGSDGSDPQGPVYLYNHELYGTTTQGGGTGCGGNGCGTVYKVKP